MLINTFLDTEDFVHLYYPEDEAPAAAQGCGAGARLASKYSARPPTPEYPQVNCNMSERDRVRAPPPPEPPPHRVRAADLYPRQRTHYDEPDLDVPFSTICGEFVQWVGRTADGGTVAMSNYRFHTHPRRRTGPGTSVPIRLIDVVEIKDIVHLLILCKDGRTIKCTFSANEQCAEWWRRLTAALSPMSTLEDTFAAAYAAWAREQPPASVHRALMKASHGPHRHWFGPEVDRLGFTAKGAWRVTSVNSDYKLCASYPPLLIVPACIGDEDLDSVARFRAMRRVPAVVWRHRGNGAVIARASQPEVGWLGWRSSEDERLLAAFVTACSQDRGLQPPSTARQTKLLIIDARSYASAVTNRARGGGCECAQYYPAADIQFMCLPNIHHVRKSFQTLRQLVAEPADLTNWHSGLERTLWLQHLSGLGRASALAARAVLAGRPVLVHCSDGWDRTPQIVAAAQLILDPYYRTLQGFRVLIEREWLDFGHKFADRCGHPFCPEEPNEKSPIFLQWLDLVHQIMLQYPCSFEFSEAYLIKLITHVYSCMFGTFLCNGPRERHDLRAAECTAHVWRLLEGPAYRNHLYCAPDGEQVLWLEYNVRSLQFWSGLMVGARADYDDACDAHQTAPAPVPVPQPQPQPTMTKTRSCDDLLSECEPRNAQRRSSDPSLVPDIMKLSIVGGGSDSSSGSRECRGVTDSYVDEMTPPVYQPETNDQVDGIHPHHFENGTDMTSTSPSLERELVSPPEERAVLQDGFPEDAQLPEVEASVPNHFENRPTDITRTSPTLERELAAVNVPEVEPSVPNHFENGTDITRTSPTLERELAAVDVPEPLNFEMQANPGRVRHISITWRSVSESSHHTDSSAGFDLTEMAPRSRIESSTNPSSSSLTNNGSTGPAESPTDNRMDNNHNRTDHNRLNGHRPDTLLAHELVCSSSESETEEETGRGPRRRTSRTHTLCRDCVHDEDVSSPLRCVCGGARPPARDPLDGLPPAHAPLQARLHHIILQQQQTLDRLSSELRRARAALPVTRAPSPPPEPPSPSSSSSEVEVGCEARDAVWLPDSAAPRCQHCHDSFWLARRRHHCRKCGGIFCSSCSSVGMLPEWPSLRVCRRCRARR